MWRDKAFRDMHLTPIYTMENCSVTSMWPFSWIQNNQLFSSRKSEELCVTFALLGKRQWDIDHSRRGWKDWYPLCGCWVLSPQEGVSAYRWTVRFPLHRLDLNQRFKLFNKDQRYVWKRNFLIYESVNRNFHTFKKIIY